MDWWKACAGEKHAGVSSRFFLDRRNDMGMHRPYLLLGVACLLTGAGAATANAESKSGPCNSPPAAMNRCTSPWAPS